MKKPFSPCKGCTPETGRSADPNCHVTCEKYVAYRREQNAWNVYERKQKDITAPRRRQTVRKKHK